MESLNNSPISPKPKIETKVHFSAFSTSNNTNNLTTLMSCCSGPPNYPLSLTLPIASFDNDDNLSYSSRYSYQNTPTSSFSACPGAAIGASTNSQDVPEAETSSQVNVRDMIRRYNLAAKSSTPTTMSYSANNSPRQRHSVHALGKQKPTHLGINKFGSQTNIRTNSDYKVEQKTSEITIDSQRGYCTLCQEQLQEAVRLLKPVNSTSTQCSPKTTTAANNVEKEVCSNDEHMEIRGTHSSVRLTLPDKKNDASVTESENSYAPIETTYTSRTTITKMQNGVRIIIDIYFDQEQEINHQNYNVLGSRIETNIPQSRILQEFQQHVSNHKDNETNKNANNENNNKNNNNNNNKNVDSNICDVTNNNYIYLS